MEPKTNVKSVGQTKVVDSFAEAFPIRCARILITAENEHWLNAAAQSVTGYGCSVIACDAEAGKGRRIDPKQTPDQRIGQQILLFGAGSEKLGKAVLNRVGQCVMTCPTTSVFDDSIRPSKNLPLGQSLRFFGDGFQKSKKLDQRRFWRIPVMDGEFIAEETFGLMDGVAGGNLIFGFRSQSQALPILPSLVERIRSVEDVILPFPGGVVRSGSKVGSRYKGLVASTAHQYCPSLLGRPGVESYASAELGCFYEIVIDGLSEQAVSAAMKEGILAAVDFQVPMVTAGNYGGKLGPFHFRLWDLLPDGST